MATTAAPQPALPNLDHLTPDALKALILTQQEQLMAQQDPSPVARSRDRTSALIFYSAFVDGRLDAPKSLLTEVHRLYFRAGIPGVRVANHVELSNAFTSAFKKLDPVPQFKATAKLGGFLAQLPA
jgi:hypothetical protein